TSKPRIGSLSRAIFNNLYPKARPQSPTRGRSLGPVIWPPCDDPRPRVRLPRSHKPSAAMTLGSDPYPPPEPLSAIGENQSLEPAARVSRPKSHDRDAPILSDASILETIDCHDRSFTRFAVVVGCDQLATHGNSIALLNHTVQL